MNKKLSWFIYDFANSAYALNVTTLFFPIYMTYFIDDPTTIWGVMVSISILLTAIMAPLFGRTIDFRGYHAYALWTITISIGGLLLLVSIAPLQLTEVFVLFVLMNTLFGVSLSIYDSFLASGDIFKKEGRTLQSSIGWAVGYIGGPLCLGLAYLVNNGDWPISEDGFRLFFLVTACFYLIFASISLIGFAKNGDREFTPTNQAPLALRKYLQDLKRSFKDDKEFWLILLAVYFLMDGLTTIMYFVSLYAKVELAFSVGETVTLLVIVQLVAIPSTVLAGWIAEKWDEIKMLIILTIFWVLVIGLIYFSNTPTELRWISVVVGFLIGSTPAIARGKIGKIIQENRRAEFFGFNVFASKVAAISGPLLFVGVSSYFGLKAATLSVIPFFFLAAAILLIANHQRERSFS